MAEIGFRITGAALERHAAVPTMALTLELEERTGTLIHGLALRCQLRIEPHRRSYSPAEAARLTELFGETPRWGDTLKPFLWTQLSLMVPGFKQHAQPTLLVPCSYDFEVAAAKYLHALEDGEIPVLALFSGAVFAQGPTGLQITQLPWHDGEASYRLPVRVWREVMDHYFPNGGWLRLGRESLDGLLRFKATRALGTWDGVVAELLRRAGEPDS